MTVFAARHAVRIVPRAHEEKTHKNGPPNLHGLPGVNFFRQTTGHFMSPPRWSYPLSSDETGDGRFAPIVQTSFAPLVVDNMPVYFDGIGIRPALFSVFGRY